MAVEFMETLKENTSANTGLSPNTLFTLFATGVTVYYMLSVFFRGSSDHRQQHTPMSSEEEEVQSRCCIINFLVFDLLLLLCLFGKKKIVFCFTFGKEKKSKVLMTDSYSCFYTNSKQILIYRSMASSSSSSSHPLKHEVFLSFRGEDTRGNFVDHLYKDLVQQGIQTYKDDETLARGDIIGPALLKAIEESRIAVVVFSKDYADSSWCLDELAHIMECMDTRGQIVMPVFYHVDPSDVRKQKGKYGKAFRKHKMENKHRVESWRKALEKAGNLSGWVIDKKSHEAQRISDIVGKISSRLSSLNTNDNKDLIGIETRLQDLKTKLETGSGGVRMVGIWGVGGGGKTTLASAVYMEISHLFEACCLLENIRDESNKYGLKKLQENFLSLVLRTKDIVVGSEKEGRSMIKRRLCHKRVLVVLDDVDDLKQLEALAGSHDWFGDGSRIIITTRDKHLLSSRAHTNIYEVSLLSHYEAIKLFHRHAYNKDKPVEDYETLSLDVVSYAGGLPLALKVLGSFLYDKDMDEWKSTLAKLKCIPEKKVMERLKISYDGLEPDQKDLFLDIACFMRHNYSLKMYDAMMVLDACNLHPVIGLKVLEQKSLIKVVDGEFEMHDLIEEMAHYIVRGEHPNNPEKHSRIWKEEDLEEFCAMGAAAPSMENEVLANLPTHISHPGLFDVLPNMKKLRWILWDGRPASSFPTNFQPTKLRCLVLRYSEQKKLWEGCKSLPNLKILDLSVSKNLIKTPDFEGLPCLERLILRLCESLEEIHPSIGYHKRLVFVDMSYCSGLESFPPIIQMQMLETLKLHGCRLQEFPDIQSNMSLPNLKILDLQSSYNLIKTPDFEGLPCLEELYLSWCTSLEEIHPSIGYHKRLVYVNMSWCGKLKSFPPIIQMQMLETLILSECHELQQFPDIQSNMSLPNLKFLYLSYSRKLIKTPDFEGLPCLEELHLSFCESLEEIHLSIGYHKRLVFVNMRGCSALKRFPPIIHMKKLETLDLRFCNQLQQFPDIQSNMDSLVTLDLHHTGIEIIPPSVARFCTNLVSLDLSDCMGLQSFHQVSLNLPQFPRSLRKLDLSHCNLGDGDIPSDIFCELVNLQLLHLCQNQFSRLPSGISRLPCLKLLNLSSCKSLVELSDLPSSIAILKAEGCDSLEIVRDLSYYKWLWKVSLWRRANKRVLLSMLEENAVKDRFMSVLSPNVQPSSIYTKLVTLQLPHNWYSDFSGFLLSLRDHDSYDGRYYIVIKQEMSTDHPEEFGEDREQCNYERVGYVPFSSLRHIPWFNPTYIKNISFQAGDEYGDNTGLNVELVRSKSKIGDLNEHPIDYSECWDEEYEDNKTFEITYDSESPHIQISWEHWWFISV